MKTTSLFALASIALSSGLMADEAPAQPLKPVPRPMPEIKIAVCGGVFGDAQMPSGLLKELKDMETNDESIQSILKDEKAKTAFEKLQAPIVLKSMEDALKHLTRDSMERIADAVDFEKQQVAIYAWQGSSQDRFRGSMSSANSADFQYIVGQTEDLKTHCAIYAMPKNCRLNVMKIEQRGFRCGVGELNAGPLGKLQLEAEPQPLNGKPAPKVQLLELKAE